jgi:hypothetical protein
VALLETLRDDFDGTTLDPAKWVLGTTAGGATHSVANSLLTLNFPAMANPTPVISINGADTYTFAGSSFSAKVTRTSQTPTTAIRIAGVQNAADAVTMQTNGGALQGIVVANGTTLYSSNVVGTYNATTHAYWRIRYTGTTIFFETSPNGSTWTVGGSQPLTTAFTSTTFRPTLRMTNGPTNSLATYQATFDKINGGIVLATPTSITDTDTLGAPSTAQAFKTFPTGLADPDTIGAPTGTQALTTAPTGLADPDTLGTPTTTQALTTAPNTLSDVDAIGAPTATQALSTSPNTLTDPDTIGEPAATQALTVAPNALTDPDTVGAPSAATEAVTAPDGLTDDEQTGDPDLNQPTAANPPSITDPDTLGEPAATQHAEVTPTRIDETETLGSPTPIGMWWVAPDTITDPDTVGTVTATGPKLYVPDSFSDPDNLTAPAVKLIPTVVNPAGITDALTPGTPTANTVIDYNTGYGTGLYGQGLYGAASVGPNGILDPAPVGEPAITTIPPVDPNTLLPVGIVDGEAFGEPVAPRTGASNYDYGAGTYGEGIYSGRVGTPTDINPTDNPTYGSGTYGYGIYYGQRVSVADALPLFTDIAGANRPPLHILGIGPWSPAINWRGAPNYSVPGGNRPSRPAMALPATTAKGVTLRLNEGSEARAELALPRGAGLIIDEMDTDLWWRRKDPRTKSLEVMGRFNTSHVNMSTSDTGISVSLQFDDYRTILGDRMVLKYRNDKVKPPESQWDDNTPVADIMAFALPTNTRLDLSEVTGAKPYNLGKTTQPFELDPATTISELFERLNAISPIRWEWWVETPLDIDAAPKLRFQLGTRGLDKGVVLHDLGKGPSPIASWTRTAAADNYANALLYLGSQGGVLETIPAQINQYGQRDTQFYNGTLDGTQIAMIRSSAKRKLEKLADRRATYTINLKAGFWRGRSHIDIGDTVTLIIKLGADRVYEKYRVTEITVDIDDVGAEEVSLTLGTPLASPDGRSKRSPIMRLVRYLAAYQAPPGSKELPTPEP